MITKAKKFLLATKLFKDNVYLDKYFQLLQDNLNTQKTIYVTQQHHIIPKHITKFIDNEELRDEVINLKYSDHLLSHYYLCLCCCDLYTLGANLKAINLIVYNRSSIKTVESIQLALEEDLPQFYQDLPQIQYDYENLAEVYKPEKRVCINKDTINKRVLLSELEIYISAGWTVGIYYTEEQRKRRSEISKMKKSAQAKENIRKGHIGVSSGMKGKKHSSETLEKLSKLKSGENNPFFGKNHSEETRKILSEQKKQCIPDDVRKDICSKYLSGYSVNKIRLEYKMSAKKVLRVLLESNIITETEYKNMYKV